MIISYYHVLEINIMTKLYLVQGIEGIAVWLYLRVLGLGKEGVYDYIDWPPGSSVACFWRCGEVYWSTLL